MSRRCILTEEEIRSLYERHIAGERITNLADECGVCRQALSKYFKKYGPTMQRHCSIPDAVLKCVVDKCNREGDRSAIKEVAYDYGLRPASVRRWLVYKRLIPKYDQVEANRLSRDVMQQVHDRHAHGESMPQIAASMGTSTGRLYKYLKWYGMDTGYRGTTSYPNK